MINRPNGMSQLDWLWDKYGGKVISNKINNIPNDDTILTEKAVIDYLNKELSKNNISLKVYSYQKNNDIIIELRDDNENILSSTKFEKSSYIVDFKKHISTLEDVDNGISTKVGSHYLELLNSKGESIYLELPSITGSESDSIKILVKDQKIAGLLKIDNSIIDKSVDLKITPNGVRAELVVDTDSNSSVVISKGENGVRCSYKWNGTENEIRFKSMKLDEYLVLPKIDYGTLYFITDFPCIYFRTIKYASSTSLVNVVTTELLDEKVANLKSEVVDGASENYNTLKKVENLITNHINNLWWEE